MRRDVITWGRHRGREAYQNFVGEPAPIGASTITYSTYDVFISHKGEDIRRFSSCRNLRHDVGHFAGCCGFDSFGS